MSFIFARKYSGQIKVLADNKMTVDSEDEDLLINSIGVETYRKIRHLGVIKNVIINDSICVSSAGILEDFNELLKYIDDDKEVDFDDICKRAFEINVNSNNRTDFIVCIAKDASKIYQIKNYKMEEVDFAWIGSKNCFEKFQSIRLSKKNNNQTIYDCESHTEIPLNSDESNDLHAFSEVLKSNIDDMVGEEVIECYSDEGKFCYLEKLSTSISKPRTLPSNKDSIKIYDDVFDGGYTYYVYKSYDNYKMYINQLKCGIEYLPYISDEKFNHLRIPFFDYCDVDEFEKKHNCESRSMTMFV